MKIYLDNCVLNRPFDDQTQDRIYLETQNLLIVLKKIEEGDIKLITSFAIEYEIKEITEWERKEKIKNYIELAKNTVTLSNEITKRAFELTKIGLIGMDALHIAAAESVSVDYFVTCDDKLLKNARRNKNKINIKVVSLFEMIGEIYNAENN